MLPLIRMTWATNRRLLLLLSPVLAFYLSLMVYTQCTQNGIDIPSIAFVIMFLLIVVFTFQGLTFDMEGFLVSLPVTRNQMVRTKYFTSLLGLLAGLTLPLTVAWLAHALAPGHAAAPTPEALRSVFMLAIIDGFVIFVFLPFVHHFEPSKGILAFSLTVILALGGGLAWKGLEGAAAVFHFFQRVLAHLPSALGMVAGLLVFGLASLSLSTWSYRRRAF